MRSIINALFPAEVSNQFRGHRAALWGFGLLTVITLGRSLVHIFKYDGGAQSIATIPLYSYSDAASSTLIGLFALWGLAQLLLGLVYLVVLIRYRTLIPLMLLTFAVEWLARLGLSEFKPIETLGTAPASVGNLAVPIIAGLLLIISLPKDKQEIR
jgi:hypothetical protein